MPNLTSRQKPTGLEEATLKERVKNDMSDVTLAAFIAEIVAVLSAIVPVIVWIRNIANGQRCQLRSEMLRIYYHNRDSERIRQYEYENFMFLYKAYKALKGNSFIDKIYEEIKKWKVIS